jgi:bacterioferritin
MESNNNQRDIRAEIIANVKKAYMMELETVMNYIANSTNLDGIRADEIAESLREDIKEELGHARTLAGRLKVLHELVPGSKQLKFDQDALQPREDQCDVVSVIHGVIEAEDAACKQYQKIIELCDGVDYVTQDVCIKLLGDEEEHRRVFEGYLKEYEPALSSMAG